MKRVLVGLALASVLTGCGAQAVTPGSNSPAPTSSVSPVSVSPVPSPSPSPSSVIACVTTTAGTQCGLPDLQG